MLAILSFQVNTHLCSLRIALSLLAIDSYPSKRATPLFAELRLDFFLLAFNRLYGKIVRLIRVGRG